MLFAGPAAESTMAPDGMEKSPLFIAVAIAAPVVILCILGVLFVWSRSKRKANPGSDNETDPMLPISSTVGSSLQDYIDEYSHSGSGAGGGRSKSECNWMVCLIWYWYRIATSVNAGKITVV